MPAAARAIGACSRDDPQPKFFPATMILYGETNSSSVWNGTWPFGRPIWAGGTLDRAYLPNILYSAGIDGLNVRYWAGMIWSVSTLSPRTNALPEMICCMGDSCGAACGGRFTGPAGGPPVVGFPLVAARGRVTLTTPLPNLPPDPHARHRRAPP